MMHWIPAFVDEAEKKLNLYIYIYIYIFRLIVVLAAIGI